MRLKAEYAKYGVIVGVLSVEENERMVCSIICGGWPSWAMGALTRGWLVTRILVKKSTWINRLKAWFTDVPVLNYETMEEWSLQSYSDRVMETFLAN